MRNFSMIDNKTFASGIINDEYPITHDFNVSNGSPGRVIAEVWTALIEGLEITSGQLRSAWNDSIVPQGVLNSPDDYVDNSTSMLSPAEYRVLCTLHLFFMEIMKMEDSVRASGIRTFVYVNINTGYRVTWVHCKL